MVCCIWCLTASWECFTLLFHSNETTDSSSCIQDVLLVAVRSFLDFHIQVVDKIMETLRNWEIELCWLHWKNLSWQHWMFLRLFIPCSVCTFCMCWVTAGVIASENGRLGRFWNRTDRCCAFSWIICDKNCQISRCIERNESLTNPTSTVGLQLLNLRLPKVMFIWVNVVPSRPYGHQTTGNARVIWSNESSFTQFPTSGRVYVWRTPKESYNPERLVQRMKHWGGSVIVWAAILLCYIGPIIILHDRITAREYLDRLCYQVHPMIQTLFPNNDAVFQNNNDPIHTDGTVQTWFE
jgi:hypothetical protein